MLVPEDLQSFMIFKYYGMRTDCLSLGVFYTFILDLLDDVEQVLAEVGWKLGRDTRNIIFTQYMFSIEELVEQAGAEVRVGCCLHEGQSFVLN